MNCPKCNSKTKVVDSRSLEEGQFRKRVCSQCGYTFFTEEYEAEDNAGLKEWRSTYMRKRRCGNVGHD